MHPSKKHFNAWARHYDRDYIWGRYFKEGYARTINIIESFNGYKSKILDIGCGTGELEKILVGKFPEINIIAIDFAERMVEIAKKKNENQRVKVFLEDINDIQFEKEKFNFVIALNVLHHIKDVETLFSSAGRMLVSGGYIIILDPLRDGILRKAWCSLLKNVLIPEYGIKYLAETEVLNAATAQGFMHVSSENVYYFSKLLVLRKK
ncbi:MAG: class I SAM-dependent methyltransferase [Patescibacteria group bacterium]